MKEDVFEALQKEGVEKVVDILLAYTRVLLNGKFWLSGKHSGPNGEEAEDFVYEAISRALDDWTWNKKAKPHVIDYLKSRIESLISNAIRLGDNLQASAIDLHTEPLEVNTPLPSPEQQAHFNGVEALMDERINASRQDSNDRIFEVYDAMKLGYQTQDIEKLLDMDDGQVNNYKKRIRRALTAFKN